MRRNGTEFSTWISSLVPFFIRVDVLFEKNVCIPLVNTILYISLERLLNSSLHPVLIRVLSR